MLPIAVCQSTLQLLTHRNREQAPSHTGKCDQPEGFAQNIDLERYLLDSNQLKDPLQQLALIKQVTATSPAT